jgi:hypothetical protein
MAMVVLAFCVWLLLLLLLLLCVVDCGAHLPIEQDLEVQTTLLPPTYKSIQHQSSAICW